MSLYLVGQPIRDDDASKLPGAGGGCLLRLLLLQGFPTLSSYRQQRVDKNNNPRNRIADFNNDGCGCCRFFSMMPSCHFLCLLHARQIGGRLKRKDKGEKFALAICCHRQGVAAAVVVVIHWEVVHLKPNLVGIRRRRRLWPLLLSGRRPTAGNNLSSPNSMRRTKQSCQTLILSLK